MSEVDWCPSCPESNGLVECRDRLQCLKPHYSGWHPCPDCDGYGLVEQSDEDEAYNNPIDGFDAWSQMQEVTR